MQHDLKASSVAHRHQHRSGAHRHLHSCRAPVGDVTRHAAADEPMETGDMQGGQAPVAEGAVPAAVPQPSPARSSEPDTLPPPAPFGAQDGVQCKCVDKLRLWCLLVVVLTCPCVGV